MLRTAEFELRARNMGITEEALVVQKVAIWEGMWATKQCSKDVEVSILIPLQSGGRSEMLLIERKTKARRLGPLGFLYKPLGAPPEIWLVLTGSVSLILLTHPTRDLPTSSRPKNITLKGIIDSEV